MPEKRVREMNKRERLVHSLSFKLFFSTFLIWMIAGMVAQAVGLLLYVNAILRENVTLAYNVSRGAALSISHSATSAKAFRMMELVKGRYQAISSEKLELMGTPDYDDLFAELQNSQEYAEQREMLAALCDYYEVDDIYTVIIDRSREAVVYVVDPDEDPIPAGYWEPIDPETADHFLNWDGHSKLFEVTNSTEWGWLCTAGTPLYNEAGLRVGFVMVDLSLMDVIREMRGYVRVFTLSLFGINLIATFFSIGRQKKQVIEPINAIKEAAMAYSADRRDGTEVTEHFSMLNIRTGDEIEELTAVMTDMERDISEYTENLASVTAEKERVATELDMAAGIQTHMLPSTFPAFPDRTDFDIFASMVPAKEVGGDFYDFFLAGEDRLCLLIADVSGKGVPAALFMMTARTMLKSVSQGPRSPAEVLRHVNAQICENNPEYMFVTVWLGFLELSTGKLTWADAGHDPLMLYQNGVWTQLPKGGGVALGFLEPELLDPDPFTDHELILKPGDALFQYTDGVTEAMTAGLEQFGCERLLAALNSAPAACPETLLPHVRKQLDAFVQGAPQFDDITMLALRYWGSGEKSPQKETDQ